MACWLSGAQPGALPEPLAAPTQLAAEPAPHEAQRVSGQAARAHWVQQDSWPCLFSGKQERQLLPSRPFLQSEGNRDQRGSLWTLRLLSLVSSSHTDLLLPHISSVAIVLGPLRTLSYPVPQPGMFSPPPHLAKACLS